MLPVRKRIAGLLLVCLASAVLVGCGARKQPPPGALSGTVSASGSTAILPLALAAKELFEEKHEWVTVNVTGGGSFNGLTQVAFGAVDIGNSDVPAPPDKAQGLVEFKVAVSPFVIVVNKDVALQDLPLDTIARIFRGEITNWKEAGGPDMTITVVSRAKSSGSRATIVETVLKNKGDFTKDALVQDSNGKIRDTIISTPGSIGYLESSYYKPEIGTALKIDGVAYSTENVLEGKYAIYSYGRMYTRGQPTGVAKEYLDFIMSPEFQEGYLQQLKFIPVTKMKQ